MQNSLKLNRLLPTFVLTGDLFIIFIVGVMASNTISPTADYHLLWSDFQLFILNAMIYLLITIWDGEVLHQRMARSDQVVRNFFWKMIVFTMLSIPISYLLYPTSLHKSTFWLLYPFCFLLILIYRLILRKMLHRYRAKGGNNCQVILVGNDELTDIYQAMMGFKASGYRVKGYFADSDLPLLSEGAPWLGKPADVTEYLSKNAIHVDHLYCSLPTPRKDEILPIIAYCENNLIRYFSLPGMSTYLKRRMEYTTFGGTIPVLAIRREPLEKLHNRFIKRCFDLVMSTFALLIVFPPLLLVFGTWIKLSSPGPIFFRQKRSGEDGKEFWCYKFRSMRVNAAADQLQATKDDPRKTKVGELMRRTNIDEIPQLINVFLGDMSLVGPRPHMLKHTAEYSAIIDRYMVRHLVKPGITGWAQVTGFRGETKELWQMEGRVRRDIWYVEHWSFWLDLLIIFRTIRNTGEKNAY